MSANLKKIIATVVSVVLLSLAYYGSYLPFAKSRLFIETMQGLSQNVTVSDFKNRVAKVLETPSPIGQEEIVRQFAHLTLGLVSQVGNQPEIISEIVSHLEKYAKPAIQRNRGMGFNQNLYILGAVNENSFLITNNPRYLASAKYYFSESLRIGPRRPQALYGMFDISRIEGDVEGVKAIAARILEQWPGDDRIRTGLSDFLKQSLTEDQ